LVVQSRRSPGRGEFVPVRRARIVISSLVTRASAALLLLGGVALLFAPDLILPRLVPGFPAAGLWIGQLLGAAWLGVAALNWLQRAAVLGGIYGRPVVLTNLVLYFVGALTLIRTLQDPAASRALWLVAAPAIGLAIVYGALLLRGPFDPLERA
jgi:hypothetical protein